jgi:hypothetical protein
MTSHEETEGNRSTITAAFEAWLWTQVTPASPPASR